MVLPFFFYNQVESLSAGQDNSMLRLIGGCLFIAYGTHNFFKKVKEFDIQDDTADVKSTRGYMLLALKGFLPKSTWSFLRSIKVFSIMPVVLSIVKAISIF